MLLTDISKKKIIVKIRNYIAYFISSETILMEVNRKGREHDKCTLCDYTEFEECDNLTCAYCRDPPAKHVLILDVNGNADKPLLYQETHGKI